MKNNFKFIRIYTFIYVYTYIDMHIYIRLCTFHFISIFVSRFQHDFIFLVCIPYFKFETRNIVWASTSFIAKPDKILYLKVNTWLSILSNARQHISLMNGTFMASLIQIRLV